MSFKESSGMSGVPEIRLPVAGLFPEIFSERSRTVLRGHTFRTAQRFL